LVAGGVGNLWVFMVVFLGKNVWKFNIEFCT
jgi:hypothetical protein